MSQFTILIHVAYELTCHTPHISVEIFLFYSRTFMIFATLHCILDIHNNVILSLPSISLNCHKQRVAVSCWKKKPNGWHFDAKYGIFCFKNNHNIIKCWLLYFCLMYFNKKSDTCRYDLSIFRITACSSFRINKNHLCPYLNCLRRNRTKVISLFEEFLELQEFFFCKT